MDHDKHVPPTDEYLFDSTHDIYLRIFGRAEPVYWIMQKTNSFVERVATADKKDLAVRIATMLLNEEK